MNLDYIWIIYKSNNKIAHNEAINSANILESKGKKVLTFDSTKETKKLVKNIQSKVRMADLAVVLGGDGTVLGAARHLASHKVPILSFNVGGTLGFLSHDKKLLNSKNLWEKIQQDHFAIQERMMLQANINIQSINSKISTQKSFWALNDFYFRSDRDEISPTCSLEVEIDGEIVDTYKGDGLIVSSPTGSTAYAMATGGPILHPEIEAIIVSAICPMSLSTRPLVVPAGSRIIIKPKGNQTRKVKLWQDGVSSHLLSPGDSCLINKSKDNAQMLILEQSASYYKTLTQKLHWAGSLIKDSESS